MDYWNQVACYDENVEYPSVANQRLQDASRPAQNVLLQNDGNQRTPKFGSTGSIKSHHKRNRW